MITLAQYINATDALTGVQLSDGMTATDVFINDPVAVYALIEALTTKDLETIMNQPTTQTVGEFSILVALLTQKEPYPVPFIQVGDKTFTAVEPMLLKMGGEDKKIEYGEMKFGDCLEAFQILDSATHKHKAIPMVLAHIYTDGNSKPVERADLFMDMDFQDALSAFFFFASLGIGYTLRTSSPR